MANQTIDDAEIDAFWNAPPTNRPKLRGLQTSMLRQPSRITCRVCERSALSDDARPGLCQDCARDPEAMERHIAGVMASCRDVLERAHDALAAALSDDPADALRVRWNAYQSALGTDKARRAEDMARQGKADALLDLVRLWLDYQQALTRYNDRAEWAHYARLALLTEDAQ